MSKGSLQFKTDASKELKTVKSLLIFCFRFFYDSRCKLTETRVICPGLTIVFVCICVTCWLYVYDVDLLNNTKVWTYPLMEQ